jgi:hypothetical protein
MDYEDITFNGNSKISTSESFFFFSFLPSAQKRIKKIPRTTITSQLKWGVVVKKWSKIDLSFGNMYVA